ncbi:MAG: GPW/gp25 family protein [Gammaproteobacteria bacterium]|nr:GPW/gp25 family protein [Gammaproteobacteria bacterium]MDH5653083.1 GPW/gp25 family protein [Gammaproteobacteria bacterium]
MTIAGQLFGRSMAFSMRLDNQQRIAWSEGSENIRESIRIILTTEPGERLMLPNFGAGLKQFLFEPNTITTHRLIEEKIRQSIELWEPRINLDSIKVIEDEDDSQAVWVMIRYTLVADQSNDQLQLRVLLAG